MTEKKETRKTTTRKTKAEKAEAAAVMYRGQRYMVIERTENQYKLTDGIIHFWVKADDVNAKV